MQHSLIRATLFSLALGAASAGFSVPATAATHMKPAVPVVEEAPVQEKVVYHINDASVARMALRNIENHLDASPGVQIVVVTTAKASTSCSTRPRTTRACTNPRWQA